MHAMQHTKDLQMPPMKYLPYSPSNGSNRYSTQPFQSHYSYSSQQQLQTSQSLNITPNLFPAVYKLGDTVKSEAENLTTIIRTLFTECKRLQDENDGLHRKVNEKIHQLTNESQSFQKSNDEVRLQLQDYKARFQALQDESDTVKRQHQHQIDEVRRENVDALRKCEQQLRSTERQLKTQNNILEELLKEREDLQEKLAESKQSRETLKKKYTKLKKKRNRDQQDSEKDLENDEKKHNSMEAKYDEISKNNDQMDLKPDKERTMMQPSPSPPSASIISLEDSGSSDQGGDENIPARLEKILSKFVAQEIEYSAAHIPLMRALEEARTKITKAQEESQMCRICFERERTQAFVPCGHFLQCEACTLQRMESSQTCDYCRQPIERVIKIYAS